MWSHNGLWMVTTDDRGLVKYWQSNFNNVHTFQAHADPVKCSRWENSCHVTRHFIGGVSNERCTCRCFNTLFIGNIILKEVEDDSTLIRVLLLGSDN